jgi:hypothetical protein
MDEGGTLESPEWSRKCVCGKRFHQLNAYSNHINGCQTYKRNVGASLELAKARYASRKSKKGKEKQRLGSSMDDDLDVDHAVPTDGPSSSRAVAPQQVEAPLPSTVRVVT